MKSRHFTTASDLTAFVNNPTQAGITVVSITSDPVNGGFWIFYNV